MRKSKRVRVEGRLAERGMVEEGSFNWKKKREKQRERAEQKKRQKEREKQKERET